VQFPLIKCKFSEQNIQNNEPDDDMTLYGLLM